MSTISAYAAVSTGSALAASAIGCTAGGRIGAGARICKLDFFCRYPGSCQTAGCVSAYAAAAISAGCPISAIAAYRDIDSAANRHIAANSCSNVGSAICSAASAALASPSAISAKSVASKAASAPC